MALELLVNSVNKIAYLKDGSLSTMLTCDGTQGVASFVLIGAGASTGLTCKVQDGATVYFDGYVRRVSCVYLPRGEAVWTYDCQNDAVADAATPSAPFNLSDTPNGTTTKSYTVFDWSTEEIATFTHGRPVAATDKAGSVTTMNAGLAPTQLVTVYYASGASSLSFRITRLTTRWVNQTPFYTADLVTNGSTDMPRLVQMIGFKTTGSYWWRYSPLATAIDVASSTTTGDTGVTTSAEMTDLPDFGVVGVQVTVFAKTTVADSGSVVQAIDYDGVVTTIAYAPGVTGYYATATGTVQTGGTNNCQMKWRAIEGGAGTLTYIVRVVGYWTVAAP